jgi:hypothetical protein
MPSSNEVGRISFDYLPGSPLDTNGISSWLTEADKALLSSLGDLDGFAALA